MISFIANPDRYGRFGHQSFSMLTAWALAAILKKKFVPLHYLYFAQHFNPFVDFGKSKYSTKQSIRPVKFCHIKGASNPDQYGNNKLALDSVQGLLSLIDEISRIEEDSDGLDVCAFLPFDQNIGLMSRVIDQRRDDLRKIFHFNVLNREEKNVDSPLTIALHIRRGDVTSKAHPTWHVPIGVYDDVIRELTHRSQNRCLIEIVSDGPPYSKDVTELAKRHKIELEGEPFLHQSGIDRLRDDVRDFCKLRSADVVVGSKSTFSWLASRVGNGKFVGILSEGESLPHSLSQEGGILFCRRTERVEGYNLDTIF